MSPKVKYIIISNKDDEIAANEGSNVKTEIQAKGMPIWLFIVTSFNLNLYVIFFPFTISPVVIHVYGADYKLK